LRELFETDVLGQKPAHPTGVNAPGNADKSANL
jgi:hypothetical protein